VQPKKQSIKKGASLLFGSYEEAKNKDDNKNKDMTTQNKNNENVKKKKKGVGFGEVVQEPAASSSSSSSSSQENQTAHKQTSENVSTDSTQKKKGGIRSALKGSRASDPSIISHSHENGQGQVRVRRGVSFDPSLLASNKELEPPSSSTLENTSVGFDVLADSDTIQKNNNNSETETQDKKARKNKSQNNNDDVDLDAPDKEKEISEHQRLNNENGLRSSLKPSSISYPVFDEDENDDETDAGNNKKKQNKGGKNNETDNGNKTRTKRSISWSSEVEDKLKKAEQFDVNNFMIDNMTDSSSSSLSEGSGHSSEIKKNEDNQELDESVDKYSKQGSRI